MALPKVPIVGHSHRLPQKPAFPLCTVSKPVRYNRSEALDGPLGEKRTTLTDCVCLINVDIYVTFLPSPSCSMLQSYRTGQNCEQ